jgi:hypothetical protein
MLDDSNKATFKRSPSSTSMQIHDDILAEAKKSALVCPEYAIDIVDKNGKSILGIAPEKKDDVPMDEKGFFTIKPFPEEGIIRVRYYNSKHQLTLVVEGKTAIEIYNTIVREKLVSRMDHAADLGAELMKAEIAMHLNIPYVQDSPLDFKNLDKRNNSGL